MKSIIRFIVISLITLILASCSNAVPIVAINSPLPMVAPTETSSKQSPTPTPLISERTLTENQIAHEAYENFMREEGQFSEIRESAMEYSFYDIDNDGVDELIGYPGYGAWTYSIYNFFEGNVNELMSIGQAEDGLIIYPEKSAFSFYAGHMGVYYDVFYQLINGKAIIVAEHDSTETHIDDYSISTEEEYTVNDKEVTETAYTEFIKNLCTGKQVKHEDLQWYQWVSTEYSDFYISSVDQSNETETHYFRFDSGANNTTSFRFIIDSDYAKLKNMKITLCDLDFKPVSDTDSFGAFEQMDYECSVSDEGGYYLKVVCEFNKMSKYNDYRDNLDYKVFISDTWYDG